MKNRVTEEDVKRNIQDVLVRTEIEFGKPVTYVTVCMKNGFTIRESTTCVDPSNYNEEIGKQICLERIKNTIYLLLGYELQSRINSGNVVSEDEEMDIFHIDDDIIVTAMDGKRLAFSNSDHLYQVDEEGELHISITPQCKQNFHHDFSINDITKKEDIKISHTYAAITNSAEIVLFKPLKDAKVLVIDEDGVKVNNLENLFSELNFEGLVFEIFPDD